MSHNLSASFDNYVPSYGTPPAQPAPWRGTIVVSGMRASDRNSTQPLHVAAVETDGETRMDLWPYQLFAYVTYGHPILHEVIAWVNQHNPPVCTFMPTQFPDGNSNTVNQSNFRSLSRILFETQTVAVASWNVDTIPGAGLIIYPAQNSSVMLVGALFLYGPFPDFILGTSAATLPMPSSIIQPPRQVHYSQVMGGNTGSASAYAAISHQHQHQHQHATTAGNNHHQSHHHHHHRQSSSPNGSDQRQQYRYMVPRNIPGVYPPTAQTQASTAAGSGAGGWPMIKSDDGGVVYTYPTRSHDNTRYA
ncbi:hypothetical protein AX17_007510 [Amanita inopinata Kibby_2008]|nr:hypothetical protein AX17_007510 [Amanita inopinata Kibby_2008]